MRSTPLEICARLCYQSNAPLAACLRHRQHSETQALQPSDSRSAASPGAGGNGLAACCDGSPSHFVSLVHSSLHFMPDGMVEQVADMSMDAVKLLRKGSLLQCHAVVNSILPNYADAYQRQQQQQRSAAEPLNVEEMLSTTLTHLLSGLANLYTAQDKFEDALCCAEEALEACIGGDASHVASSWFDIGCLRILAQRPAADISCALRIAYETLLDHADMRQPPTPTPKMPGGRGGGGSECSWVCKHSPNVVTALTMLLLAEAETKTSPVYTKANGGTYISSLLHSFMLYQHKVEHHEDPRDLVFTLRAIAAFFITHHSYEVASRYLVEEVRIRQTLVFEPTKDNGKPATGPAAGGVKGKDRLYGDNADIDDNSDQDYDDNSDQDNDDEFMQLDEDSEAEDDNEDESMTGGNYFDALARLGQCFHQGLRRPQDALQCFQQALDLRIGTVLMAPASSQVTVARVLYNIGAIHTDLAAQFMESESSTDDIHANNFTRAFHRQQALDSFELCLGIRRCALGSDDQSVGAVLYSMAVLRIDAGQFAEAYKDLEESLRIRKLIASSRTGRNNAAASDRALFDTFRRMGMVRKRQGENAQALSLYQRAITCIRRVTYSYHGSTPSGSNSADCVFLQARALVEIGQVQQSLRLLEDAIANFQEAAMWLRCYRSEHHINTQSSPIASSPSCCSRHSPERHAQRRRLLMVEILNGIGFLELERSNSDSARAFFAEAALLSGKNIVGCAAAA